MTQKGLAGHKARKRFGQNFLHDEHWIGRIARTIDATPADTVVEIGPGQAALTRKMIEQAGHVTAVEIDRDLAAWLRETFPETLTLIEADALKVNFEALPGAGNLRVFGNLPYNITSPIIFHLLSQRGIKDMHFMLQKEVVDRLCAGPHCRDYGRLTVMVQYHAQVIPVLDVPPEAFRPRPKVNSAVVRLKPKALSDDERALAPFLNTVALNAFNTRRKTLRNSLSTLFSAEEMQNLGIDISLRAEDLNLESFIVLATALRDKKQIEATI